MIMEKDYRAYRRTLRREEVRQLVESILEERRKLAYAEGQQETIRAYQAEGRLSAE